MIVPLEEMPLAEELRNEDSTFEGTIFHVIVSLGGFQQIHANGRSQSVDPEIAIDYLAHEFAR